MVQKHNDYEVGYPITKKGNINFNIIGQTKNPMPENPFHQLILHALSDPKLHRESYFDSTHQIACSRVIQIFNFL